MLNAAALLCALGYSFAPSVFAEDKWVKLFNGTDLSGFDVQIRDQKPGEDLGKIFQVHDGVIHVYKDTPAGDPGPFGVITTTGEYSQYRLRFQYKWGEKKFAPRVNSVRDAGVLYHVAASDTRIWPTSVECQVQENDVGDVFTVRCRVDTTAEPDSKPAKFLEKDAGGVPATVGVVGGIARVVRDAPHEIAGWNTVEVVVDGPDVVHIVNGKVNNRIFNMHGPDPADPKNWIPLTRGKISFQAEGAEIFYRGIEIENAETAEEPRGAENKEKGLLPEPLQPGGDGSLELPVGRAERAGGRLRLDAPERALDGWSGPDDRAVWTVAGLAPGAYDVTATWARPDGGKGPEFLLEADGKPVHKHGFKYTGGAFESYVVGQVKLDAGPSRIAFRPAGPVEGPWIRLRSLRLVPGFDAGRGTGAGPSERRSVVRPGSPQVGELEGSSSRSDAPTLRHSDFRPPPLEVPDGFEVVPAALPPLLHHPMMACLDERGRLFVAESAGVNMQTAELLEKKPHKILMLEDSDQDGAYDKSTVFAEGLVLPNGAQWHDGALYVASIPYIWRFEDADGDGKAEKQDVVFGKFYDNGMSSAFHGPVLGPDGRFYFCGGQLGWTLGDKSPGLSKDGPWTSHVPGAFSCRPDGSDPEALAHGGLANPVEATFTEEGEVLGTIAILDQAGGRHDALVHWIDGGVYNLRPDRAATLKRTSFEPLPPLSRRGHVAPAGVTRYRSTTFGGAYRDNIFLAEFNTHKVIRLAIERDGAGFRVKEEEVFLHSASPYTHFTDVLEDADGSLLVLDTGGWFLYGCPTSSLSRPDLLGGVYRIRKKGATPPEDPRGGKLAWGDDVPPGDLAGRLDDPRPAVIDRALAALGRRGDAAVEALCGLRSSESAAARRHAVWALVRIGTDPARAAVRAALADADRGVRLAALRGVGCLRDATARGAAEALLADQDPELRREAATALGRIGKPEAVPALLASLREPANDRFLDHALILALIRLNSPGPVRAALTAPDSSPNLRRAALIALDPMDGGGLSAAEVAPFLDAKDAALRDAALNIMARHPDWGDAMAGYFRREFGQREVAEVETAAMREFLLTFRAAPAVQAEVAAALGRADVVPAVRGMLVDFIGASGLPSPPKAWIDTIGRELASADPTTARRAVAAAEKLGSAALDGALAKLAEDAARPAGLRIAAAEAVAPRAKAVSPEVFDLLAGRMKPEAPAAERLAAARTLGKSRLSVGQLVRLGALLAAAGPVELPAVVPAFRRSKDEAAGRALVAGLDKSPGLWSIPADELVKLLAPYPEPVRTAAAPLEARLRGEVAAQAARLAELELGLAPGDPARGRTVFFGKGTCHVCHRIGSEGGVVGPDLSKIGEIRTSRDFLEAIAFPSASFAREFEPHILQTKDEQTVTGRLAGESEAEVVLITAQGEERRIPRAEIAAMAPGQVSMMPLGLDRLMTASELNDLLAFLSGLK